MNQEESMSKLMVASLCDDGSTRDKVAKDLHIEKDENGKYLQPYIKHVAEINAISIDDAKHMIHESSALMRLMVVLA